MCDSVIVLELMFLFMLSVHLGLDWTLGPGIQNGWVLSDIFPVLWFLI